MKFVGSLFAAVALAAITSRLPAATAQTLNIWVYSNGTDSCGEWTANRTRSPDGAMAHIELSWVLGWLTGTDAEIEGFRRNEHFRHVDSDAVAGWLDNYCRSHPLEPLVQAASALNAKLRVK